MIVCERQKLVIITPPKTGSTSLHRHLIAAGCLPVYSPDPSGKVSKHGVVVPLEYVSMEFRVAVVVRNPYDRLVSQYAHYCNWLTSQGRAAPSIGQFCGALPDDIVFGWTLAQTLGDIRWQELWKLETLATHLAAHGLPNVPRENETWHLPADVLLVGDVRPAAERATAMDRMIFGY